MKCWNRKVENSHMNRLQQADISGLGLNNLKLLLMLVGRISEFEASVPSAEWNTWIHTFH